MLQQMVSMGAMYVVISQEKAWKVPRNLAQAIEAIDMPQAKNVEQSLELEKKLKEVKSQAPEVTQKLIETLATYGKELEDIEEMQPNDFIRLNKAVAGRLEYLLAVYSDGIQALKALKEGLEDLPEPEGGPAELRDMKTLVADHLAQKGLA
jgi:hypothetical protein